MVSQGIARGAFGLYQDLRAFPSTVLTEVTEVYAAFR
jgi:hypothetical protein